YPCPAQAQAIAGFAAPQGSQGCGVGGDGGARAAPALQFTGRDAEAASRVARSLSTKLGRALRGAGRDRRGPEAEAPIGCSRQAQVNALRETKRSWSGRASVSSPSPARSKRRRISFSRHGPSPTS